MALQIGAVAPDFEAQTTEGKIKFHDWIGNSWALLFSHPKDFTPVCTTELGALAKLKPEFDNVSKLYDMLPASTSGDPLTRTPADNQTVRNVFVIGPDKKIKLVMVYPMTTGRNFQEILRSIDSLQMTAKHRVATPADWKQGEDVIIAGSVSDDEAKTIYPQGWKAPKPYIRIVPQPK
jgi:alkyl hydroperoxide reductase subunit AhpC